MKKNNKIPITCLDCPFNKDGKCTFLEDVDLSILLKRFPNTQFNCSHKNNGTNKNNKRAKR